MDTDFSVKFDRATRARCATCSSQAGSLCHLALLVAVATDKVIVHHAGGLHVSVDDCAADELESAFLQVLAECVGFFAGRRNLLAGFPFVLLGLAVDELPNVFIKAAEFILNFQELLRVGDGGVCLLYTSPSPRDKRQSRMPSSA